MVSVLYTFDRGFMRKTFESVDRHLDADSAYLPMHESALGASDQLREIDVDPSDEAELDAAVRRLDPDAVVRNHRSTRERVAYDGDYDVVHLRHGASVGRGEISVTAEKIGDIVDVALAPGRRWAERYESVYPETVDVSVVGIPEADAFVDADPPRDRTVLYAPTNHKHGGGCYFNTAEHVLDTFAHTDYRLLFRPHPVDREEEPGRSLTESCRGRIADIPNVEFDDNETPRESMLAADVLVSDYSGIVAEWLHTDRPLVQLTDLAADDAEVPKIGHTTRRIDLETVDDLYANGYPPALRERRDAALDALGIPTDGRAGRRAAEEVMRCTA